MKKLFIPFLLVMMALVGCNGNDPVEPNNNNDNNNTVIKKKISNLTCKYQGDLEYREIYSYNNDGYLSSVQHQSSYSSDPDQYRFVYEGGKLKKSMSVRDGDYIVYQYDNNNLTCMTWFDSNGKLEEKIDLSYNGGKVSKMTFTEMYGKKSAKHHGIKSKLGNRENREDEVIECTFEWNGDNVSKINIQYFDNGMDDGDATITFTYSDYKNPYYNMPFPASAFDYIEYEQYMLFNLSSKLPSSYIWEDRAYGDYEYEETEISVFDSEDGYPTEIYDDGETYTITYISE